jgi:hypothetical protein
MSKYNTFIEITFNGSFDEETQFESLLQQALHIIRKQVLYDHITTKVLQLHEIIYFIIPYCYHILSI